MVYLHGLGGRDDHRGLPAQLGAAVRCHAFLQTGALELSVGVRSLAHLVDSIVCLIGFKLLHLFVQKKVTVEVDYRTSTSSIKVDDNEHQFFSLFFDCCNSLEL